MIQNHWTSKGEEFSMTLLKKVRRLRLRGLIAANQAYQVYINYDDAGSQLIGTVRGDGSYVDYTNPQSVGGNMVGGAQVGGDDFTDAYPYFVEIRIKKPPKFLNRKLTFVALGFGHVDINYQNDYGILGFENKLPSRFRQKQNVSLDGTQSDLPGPDY